MKIYLPFLAFISLLGASCNKSGTYLNNPGAPDYLHNRPVGASAKELLTLTEYQSLRIEILYMPGFAPDAAAVNHMQATLTGLLHKPAGISVVLKEIPAASNSIMTINDIIDAETKQRTVFTSGGQIGVCIIYTNGNYTDNNTLGVAYRNTSAAIFGKMIQDNSGGIGQTSRTKLEATVLEHELGHLLGLVDLGSPMQAAHKDPAHGNHCNNSNCLMYHASETFHPLMLLAGPILRLMAGNKSSLQSTVCSQQSTVNSRPAGSSGQSAVRTPFIFCACPRPL